MKMKATFTRNIALTDLFRALAGAPEATFDMIANTVYTAAYTIMQAGNKTQFAKLEQDAKLYGGDTSDCAKAVKAALGVDKVNAACKHFRKVYFSVATALEQMPAPALVKDLPQGKAEQNAILDPLAQDYADQFTAIFINTLTMPEKTAAEQEAAKTARAATKAQKDKAKEKALKATIKAEAEKLATVQAVSLADMARTVANALRAGTLDAELESELVEAAQLRETARLLAAVSSAPAELATAH